MMPFDLSHLVIVMLDKDHPRNEGPTDPFAQPDPRVEFKRILSRDDKQWWTETFGARAPLAVAERLSRGLPGEKNFEFDIDGIGGTFLLDMTGRQANATIWYYSSALQLRWAEFYQDGVNISMSARGLGLVQRLIGNAADLAQSVGVRRLTLDARDIGGYMWARAGAVPQGSWLGLRQTIERRVRRLLDYRKEITVDDAEMVDRLLKGGERNPRMFWALASLRNRSRPPIAEIRRNRRRSHSVKSF